MTENSNDKKGMDGTVLSSPSPVSMSVAVLLVSAGSRVRLPESMSVADEVKELSVKSQVRSQILLV